MNKIEKLHADNFSSADGRLVKRSYSAPNLICYGDLHTLTMSGLGSLETKSGGNANSNNGANFRT